MNRFFVATYRFFKPRKWLLALVGCLTFLVFIICGLHVRYEEDITKLFPPTTSEEASLAFNNVKVKDKIFIQMATRDGSARPSDLSPLMDSFMDLLMRKDSVSGHISGALYKIDADLAVTALDYALGHVPSFVDTSLYAAFDAAMTPQAASEKMASNYVKVMSDVTGSATTMVATDPFGLKDILFSNLLSSSGGSGFTVVDGHLFSKDSTVALSFISPDFNYQDSGTGTVLIKEIEAAIDDFEKDNPDVEVMFHGAPVMSVGNSRYIKRDLFVTVGLSLLLILAFILFFFRDWKVAPYLVVPVLYGTFFALSCVWWIKGGMSLMALALGAVVLGVAISYCLHVITHYKYTGDPEKVLEDESEPVVLGCLTTVGSFLGLLFTTSELLRDFAIFGSFALIGNTLFALIFLPHMLERGENRRNDKAFALVDRLNSVTLENKKWLIGSVVLVAAVCITFSPRVEFDNDMRHISIQGPKADRSEALYAEKNSGGKAQGYYAAASSDPEEALAVSRMMYPILDSLENEGVIDGYSSIAGQLFVPERIQRERIGAWAAYWSPERRARAEKVLGSAAREVGLDPGMFGPFFAMTEASYEPDRLYAAGIIPEEILSNFMEVSPDGRYMVFTPVRLDKKDKDRVGDAVTSIGHTLVMDPMYYTNDMVSIVHDDFSVAMIISSVFVLLVLLLSFRNFWIALLAFLPMFLSWYVVQGAMALLGIKFNLINIVISTFIFGIGVDYSIFVMQGLLEEARTRRQSLLLWHKSAIFFSAVVLLIVVLSLLTASHPAVRSIGSCTLIGMGSTILLTYTLQPFLFRQMMKVPYWRRSFGAGNEKK